MIRLLPYWSRYMKRALLACCIGVLAPFSGAVAQDTAPALRPSWGIMAGGEVSRLQNSLSGSGPVIAVLANFPIESSHLAIRVDAMFHYLSVKCGFDTICSPGTAGSGSVSAVARLNDSAARWSPYVIAGLAGFVSEGSAVGLAGGAGFEVRGADHTYFIEARYMRVYGGGLVPITLGMRF
jgi:hypothetical protein